MDEQLEDELYAWDQLSDEALRNVLADLPSARETIDEVSFSPFLNGAGGPAQAARPPENVGKCR